MRGRGGGVHQAWFVGFVGVGEGGTLRHLLYFGLAEEWGEAPHLLHPGSVAAALCRRVQTDTRSSPSGTPEAAAHAAVARVCPERESWGCVRMQVCAHHRAWPWDCFGVGRPHGRQQADSQGRS